MSAESLILACLGVPLTGALLIGLANPAGAWSAGASPPPIDLRQPTRIRTATFALG